MEVHLLLPCYLRLCVISASCPVLSSYLNYRDKKARARAGNPPDELYALRDALAEERPIKIPNPLTTLQLLFELSTGSILLCNGFLFA